MDLPSYRWRFAHLAALWAYGVGQPVFSMLKGNPEFLVVRGSTRWDVIVFALLLAVVPPLVVVGAEALAALLSRTLAGALHIVAIWSFSFLVALQLARLLDPERGAALLLPMVPAALAAIAYLRWRAFRSFLSISLVLPLIGLLGFVATVPLAVDDAAGANVPVATHTPVVLVVFDEFPVSSLMRADGSLDTRRYPNFGRLARDATWYPRATTVHDSTTHAVPAILTGQLPRKGELPTLKDHPDNLFTLLGGRYVLRASEQVTRLCPARYCPRTRDGVTLTDRERGLFYDASVGYLHRVLPRALREGLPPIGERWGGFGNSSEVDVRERIIGALDSDAWLAAIGPAESQRRSQFQDFLRSLRPPEAGQRVLHVEHALLPHGPWGFLPSGRQYGSAMTVAGIEDDWKRWRSSPLFVDQALQRHLLQVGYVDRLVGALVRRLKQAGLYDRALVVVTADHGISFEPGGSTRSVTRDNLPDIAGVPLFVKYPGQQRGLVDRRDVQTIDIVPTIADVIGARIPWHVDGLSLRGKPVVRPVTVRGPEGGSVSAGVDAVAAGVLATARRNAALFGQGPDSLYRLGVHRELLGRSVAALPPSTVERVGARLVDEEQFDGVRTTSLFSPSHIVGEVQGVSLSPGTPVAIVVDERVAATTRTYGPNGRQFEAMVPEGAFHEGKNTVDVFRVRVVDGAKRSGRQVSSTVGAGQVSDGDDGAP